MHVESEVGSVCCKKLMSSFYLQLLWELELEISKITKKKCEHRVFMDRWKALQTCFVDDPKNMTGMFV